MVSFWSLSGWVKGLRGRILGRTLWRTVVACLELMVSCTSGCGGGEGR